MRLIIKLAAFILVLIVAAACIYAAFIIGWLIAIAAILFLIASGIYSYFASKLRK